jgi:CRP/FNR family transcriptional regulator, cyclic AMP receptor protein
MPGQRQVFLDRCVWGRPSQVESGLDRCTGAATAPRPTGGPPREYAGGTRVVPVAGAGICLLPQAALLETEGHAPMQPQLAEIVGVAAAAASLYAVQSKTIIPLRGALIAANLLAMIYSFLHGTYPTFALNAVLLPLNAWRLRSMIGLIHDTEAAAKGGMNVEWLLPYTRPKSFMAGAVLMERGEYATAAYYIASGEVEVVETNQTFGKGTLLGEIGLFTPDGRRTKTVRCKTDVQTAVIDYDRFKELYFQNPQFGFRLLHLVVARLQSELPRPAVPA